jgi:hypothetical protein
MAPGLIKLLKEMSTRNLPGGKKHPVALEAGNLTATCEPIV